jgi:hypothetical protein
MSKPRDEMRREPEIERTQLPVILPLAQTGIGESLAIRIDELVSFQLIVKLVLGPGEFGLLGGELTDDDAVACPQQDEQDAHGKMDPGTCRLRRPSPEPPKK